MKIQIPNKIKIGGVWVSIIYEAKLLDNHGKYGQSRFAECEIAMEPKLEDDMKGQCLIHELMHFLDKQYTNYSLEERETDALATGLHALLVDMGVEFGWDNIS